MVEIIIVVALVVVALAFLTKSLYNIAVGNSHCGCEGKVCLGKKNKVM